MQRSWRNTLALVGLLSLALSTAACSSGGTTGGTSGTGSTSDVSSPSEAGGDKTSQSAAKPDGDLAKITVSMLTDDTAMPVWLAQKLGYFEDNGLDVTFQYSANGAAALPAGVAGDWQAGWIGAPPALTGWDKWGLISFPHIKEQRNLKLIMRNDALDGKTPAEVLKTGKIGTGANSTYENLLFECAKHFGVDPGDLQIVPLDPPQVRQALASGQIQAGTTSASGDFDFVNDKDKYTMVCDGDTAGANFITMYMVTPKFFDAHPDQAAEYVDAVYRANEYVNENPGKATDYMVEFGKEVGLDINKQKAEYTLKARDWVTLDQAISDAKDGTTQKTLEQLVDFFVQVGVYTDKPDVAALEAVSLKVLNAAKDYRDKQGR